MKLTSRKRPRPNTPQNPAVKADTLPPWLRRKRMPVRASWASCGQPEASAQANAPKATMPAAYGMKIRVTAASPTARDSA